MKIEITEAHADLTDEEAMALVPERYREHLRASSFSIEIGIAEPGDTVEVRGFAGCVMVKTQWETTYHYRGRTIERQEDTPAGYWGAWRTGIGGHKVYGDSLSDVKSQIDSP